MKKILLTLLGGAGIFAGYTLWKDASAKAADLKLNQSFDPEQVKKGISACMYADEQNLTKDKFLPTSMADAYAFAYLNSSKEDLNKLAVTLKAAGYKITADTIQVKADSMQA